MLPPTKNNIIFFELDYDVKFPLLRLLQFLSTILFGLLFNNLYYNDVK